MVVSGLKIAYVGLFLGFVVPLAYAVPYLPIVAVLVTGVGLVLYLFDK